MELNAPIIQTEDVITTKCNYTLLLCTYEEKVRFQFSVVSLENFRSGVYNY